MYYPTEEELEAARRFQIDPTGLDGPMLQQKIQKAEDRYYAIVGASDAQNHRKILRIAGQLGLENPSGASDQLAAWIEARLFEIFQAKGISRGVIIEYDARALSHKGERAMVTGDHLYWVQGMPCMTLHFENKTRDFSYSAVDMALYATVVG